MSKELFIEHYKKIFGDEWESLWNALQEKRPPILRFHPNNANSLQSLFAEHNLEWHPLAWYPNAIEWPQSTPLDTELPGYSDHLFYVMSASSLIPVLALDPQPGEKILDACAAPGGKALFIADVTDSKADLIANDTSPDRRRRMQEIFTQYNHPEITIWNKKAEILFRQYPDTFDRVLVDAPCSSEMHVIRSPHHLEQWTPGRSRSLQYRQLALLSGLFNAVKPGGRLVYSTCAVTPEENESVVARFLKKKGDAVRQLPWTLPCPGPRILPHCDSLDPMYIAIFERVG